MIVQQSGHAGTRGPSAGQGAARCGAAGPEQDGGAIFGAFYGAIFGAFYKVTSPTILAPWFALGLLVLGFASTWVLRARRSAATQLTDLSAKTPA